MNLEINYSNPCWCNKPLLKHAKPFNIYLNTFNEGEFITSCPGLFHYWTAVIMRIFFPYDQLKTTSLQYKPICSFLEQLWTILPHLLHDSPSDTNRQFSCLTTVFSFSKNTYLTHNISLQGFLPSLLLRLLSSGHLLLCQCGPKCGAENWFNILCIIWSIQNREIQWLLLIFVTMIL